MATSRFPTGICQSAVFQALGGIGLSDPFYYNSYSDDYIPYVPALYTVTAPNSGSIVRTNGMNGRILLTTGTTPGNYAAEQLTSACFQYVAGKKLAFLIRFQLADTLNPYGVVGLIQTTTTPNTVTDGFWISKTPGTTNLTYNISSGGSVIGTGTFISPLLPNNTDIDVGFLINKKGDMEVFLGVLLEGKRDEDNSPVGPVGRILNSSLTGPMPSVLLNPTISLTTITSGATAINDFIFAAQER